MPSTSEPSEPSDPDAPSPTGAEPPEELDPAKGPWELSFQWREEVYYWEGKRGFCFLGGWGALPPVTYVPDAAHWASSVPAWMKDRRDEILARLRSNPHHVVEETDGYSGGEVSR